jgi:hypothetical protein
MIGKSISLFPRSLHGHIVFFLMGAFFASAATFHVSLQGNDANAGTRDAPWRTIVHACAQVEPDQGHIIAVDAGTFEETSILSLKSGVSLIGAGKDQTIIRVNHFFSLTDAVPNANPHVHTFPEQFVLQLSGRDQLINGLTFDGQKKRCHGGIFAARAERVTFENLRMHDFRYAALWVIEAYDTTLQDSEFLNNTYGNPRKSAEGGGDSGAVQYHRGKNLIIRRNRIEETGNLRPGAGGYALKAQDRKYSVSADHVLENFQLVHNTLIVPTTGAWENGKAPAITAEFLGMALKDAEMAHNYLNNHISLAGTASLGKGIRIHHNFFDLGRDRYAYGIEVMMDHLEIDHNHFYGGLYPIAVWQKHPKHHLIHHNLFEAACVGRFAGRELLRYQAPITDLRFFHNTVIDHGSIGSIFALHQDSTFQAHNNAFFRTGEPKDIWGTEIAGEVSHNFFARMTPRGLRSFSSEVALAVTEQAPIAAPYASLRQHKELLDRGKILPGINDPFAGSAPDLGALENDQPFVVPAPALAR